MFVSSFAALIKTKKSGALLSSKKTVRAASRFPRLTHPQIKPAVQQQ